MSKEEIKQRFRAELIRNIEARTGNPWLIHALEECAESGEITPDLLEAMERELRNNNTKIEAFRVLIERQQAVARGRALLDAMGDFLPLCIHALTNPPA